MDVQGIFGAVILGLGRAVGETMAVTMVIGNAIGPNAMPNIPFQTRPDYGFSDSQRFLGSPNPTWKNPRT